MVHKAANPARPSRPTRLPALRRPRELGARGYLLALLGLQLALAVFALAAKEATALVAPLTLEWARRLLAGLVLLVAAAAMGQGARPRRADLLDAVVPGLLGFGLGRACVMLALSMTSATNVAVIDSAAPAVALVLALALGRERGGRLAVGGSLLAFAGVIALVLSGGGLSRPAVGDLVATGSPLAWGFVYIHVARRAPDPASLLRRTAWFSLAGAAALTVPAVAPGPDAIGALAMPAVAGVLALGVAIGLVENALTFGAIGVLGPVRTAEFEYLVPVLVAAVGFAAFGAPVLGVQIVTIAMVLGGLLIASRGRSRAPEAELLPGEPCCVA